MAAFPDDCRMHGSLGLGRRRLVTGMAVEASIREEWVEIELEGGLLEFVVG